MNQTSNGMMAVNLPHEPREYMCTWHLPKAAQDAGEDRLVDVLGMIDLDVRHNPTALFQGTLPYMSADRVAEFPQYNDFDCLTGTLSSGIHVGLLNGQTHYWLHNGGGANGAFAVLSNRPFVHNEYRKYQSIELQIDDLDRVFDVPPTSLEFVRRTDERDESYKISIPARSSLDWKSQEAQMCISYTGRLCLDRFDFRASFAPYLRIDLDQPISLVDWWLQWVVPLCYILEVINGRPLDVMYLLAFENKNATHPKRRGDQVFRYDIMQGCIKIDEKRFNRARPIVNLKEDEVDLLKLTIRHRELEALRHPLIETYRCNAVSDDQHPRSRYLLLIQALEGLYGHEHKEVYQRQCEQYAEKREALLERVGSTVNQEDFKFLKRNLLRKPPSGLMGALSTIYKALPETIRSQIDNSKIVLQTRNSCAKKQISSAEALTTVRNRLSHGSSAYDPKDLEEICSVLDKIVRAEILRVLDLPEVVRQRMLES
ncbi:MAG: hypothetical protein Q4C85_06400 [Actinomyces sp.]|uniref:ApeA N-terminal domain 1-containing protein n=1 Tax=Actinomyces sp. TaxID=29317 RepID=UPI0026DC54C6|nr:HEPN domain-containing protein [Actinomyces sp.]MDO4243376.1 hypothetical protein [Actinomyces sp.]